MKKTTYKTSLVIIALFVLILQACGPAAPAEPTPTAAPDHVKILILPYLSYAPYFVAQDEGYFAEQNLEVEFVRMEQSAEAIPALAQGQLDVSSGLLEVSAYNAIAQGTNIKIVSDKGFSDPNAGCSYTSWIARKALLESGELENPETLKGKKVGISITATTEYALDLLLERYGLTSADLELIDISQPQRFEGLTSGAIDIANASEPWILRNQDAGNTGIWVTNESYMQDFQFSVQYFGPSILDKNPDVGKRFMVAYLKAVAKLAEGKTDRNVEIVAKYTKLTPDELNRACWQTFRADGMINVQSILDLQAWAIEKGYLLKAMTQEQLWDPTYVNYANQVLKGAQP